MNAWLLGASIQSTFHASIFTVPFYLAHHLVLANLHLLSFVHSVLCSQCEATLLWDLITYCNYIFQPTNILIFLYYYHMYQSLFWAKFLRGKYCMYEGGMVPRWLALMNSTVVPGFPFLCGDGLFSQCLCCFFPWMLRFPSPSRTCLFRVKKLEITVVGPRVHRPLLHRGWAKGRG